MISKSSSVPLRSPMASMVCRAARAREGGRGGEAGEAGAGGGTRSGERTDMRPCGVEVERWVELEVPKIVCRRHNLAERKSRAAGMRVRVCIVVGSEPMLRERGGGTDA
jgi:hypothetical protein